MRVRNLLLAIALFALVCLGAGAIVTQPFVQPIASPEVLPTTAANPEQLQAHVRYLSQTIYPRSHDQHANLELAAAYIQQAFEAAGATVSTQAFTVSGVVYKNVVAKFGPHAAADSLEPILVIGAHYDSHADSHADVGDPAKPGFSLDTHTPGADDNASGVAGLLELARMLGRTPQRRSIELVAYTLEEPPHFRSEHMGSAWHASALKTSKRPVELMLSLETIGYFSDAPDSQEYPSALLKPFYPNQGNFIALVGKLGDFGAMRRLKAAMAGATPLPVYSINAPPQVLGIDFSDHLSYWNEGIPAIMITDTAFMRNKNYHLPGDTFEKLDYVRMAQVVQGVYAFATSNQLR